MFLGTRFALKTMLNIRARTHRILPTRPTSLFKTAITDASFYDKQQSKNQEHNSQDTGNALIHALWVTCTCITCTNGTIIMTYTTRPTKKSPGKPEAASTSILRVKWTFRETARNAYIVTSCVQRCRWAHGCIFGVQQKSNTTMQLGGKWTRSVWVDTCDVDGSDWCSAIVSAAALVSH